MNRLFDKEVTSMDRSRIPLKPGMLYRPRLDNLLRRCLTEPLVTVVAGSGYGKTQAVAQFAVRLKQPLVWVSLSKLDNDVSHFWTTVINALRYEMPKLAEVPEKWGFPSSKSIRNRYVRDLVWELHLTEGSVLVVDNYSQIHNKVVRGFIEDFIRLGVENSTAILISTAKEDMGLGWELAGADHTAITTADLRFSRDELAEYCKLINLSLSNAEIDGLLEYTEGWPLAVYLADRRHREGACPLVPHQPIEQIAGFFANEFFSKYSEDYRRLLIRLSLLPGFSLEMVKELSGTRGDEYVDTISSNLFISLDHSTGTLNFHKLYQEFLHDKLYLLDVAVRKETYTLAGKLFLERRQLLEAVECFFQSAEYDRMMEAVISYPAERVDVTLSNFVLDYLERLPAAYTATRKLVSFCMAYHYLNRLQVRKAMAIFEELAKQLEGRCANREEKMILGESWAVLGDIFFLRNEDRFLEAYKKGAEYLPKGSLFHGKQVMAVENNTGFFLPGNKKGQLETIVQRVFEATRYSERFMNGQGQGLEWLFAAGAAYFQFDLSKAEEYCHSAVSKAMNMEQHDTVCNAYFLLAHIAVLKGQYAALVRQLDEIHTYIGRDDVTYILEADEYAQSWFTLIMGEPDKVAVWVTEKSDPRSELRPIGMGRNKLIHAFYLHAKHRDQEAVNYLSGLEYIYEEKGLWVVRLRHRLLKAVCHVRLGQKEQALEELWAAYDMTHQNALVTPFVEYGNEMRELVSLARKCERHSFETEWLDRINTLCAEHAGLSEQMLREHRKRSRHIPRSSTSLSRREREVLQKLSMGLMRDEIADDLRVSINSVKKYIASLYCKLGAVNSAAAIRIATEKGELSL